MSEMLSELETRKKGREADFWTTACKLAAGEKVTPAAVERLLAESGRTPADLKAAVELMQQRRQWAEVVAGAAALEKERASINEHIAAEDRKLAAAEQAHTDATAPMHFRLDLIRAGMRDVEDARHRLIETSPYDELKAELAAVRNRLTELRDHATELRRRAGRAKEAEADLLEAERHLKAIEPGSDPRRAEEWRERAERNRRAAENAKAAIPAVDKEIVKLEREEAAIRERMTKP